MICYLYVCRADDAHPGKDETIKEIAGCRFDGLEVCNGVRELDFTPDVPMSRQDVESLYRRLVVHVGDGISTLYEEWESRRSEAPRTRIKIP